MKSNRGEEQSSVVEHSEGESEFSLVDHQPSKNTETRVSRRSDRVRPSTAKLASAFKK
jgi:hypothetical protein